jgi:DNA-binding LacI/PurR family transcriptional regulator
LLLSDTSEAGPVERDVVERTLDLVEGVVLASSRMSDSAIRMIAKQKPLVLLNRQMPDTSCIVTDNPRGVRRAVEHLASLGHDTITYVAGPAASWPEGVRWRALREAGDELELRVRRVDPDDVPTMRTGLHVARRIADENATAVLAYNDALAIGVINGLKHLGVRVPDEVSVVGIDNVMLAEVVDPALTTITAPMRKMGAAGVGNVLALAAGAKTSGETLVLPVKLVVRASTARRPAAKEMAAKEIAQCNRKSISPALGTTRVSGSAANASGSTDAGSR